MPTMLGSGIHFQKARKEYVCDACGSIIKPRQRYGKYKSMRNFPTWFGEIKSGKTYRFCMNCMDAEKGYPYDSVDIVKESRVANISQYVL